MKPQLEKRLAELKTEFNAGQKMLADLQAKQSDLETTLKFEGELQDIAINSADHREGVSAFLEKRPPRYQGR